ncbi:MAG: hypothetical protein CL458_00785 [Acidimicrobiaceae bacterium]|nr:hypothetical protein [Acidimicrobiaceae bacterium]|tara:strand:- start:892 stop:1443 length:552 start_codon:yes stop_codon:yes gene_type:complete
MILVDTPRWSWKGQLWGHLVSDASLHELHTFAQQIGKRRIGFQGDHYDVNEDEHQLAVEAGATQVDSRELVRRLRDAGLRHRGSRAPWNVIYESKGPQALSGLLTMLSNDVSSHGHRARFHRTLTSGGPQLEVLGALMVERFEASAIVLDLKDRPFLDSRDLDLFVDSQAGDSRVVELIIGDC